jgi:hypothetical protein
VYFSGDITDTATIPQCATLAYDNEAGAWALTVNASSSKVPALAVTIDFASVPTTGTVSSDTVPGWAVVESTGTDACAVGGGSAAVPTGSFTLAVEAAETSPDASSPTLHGTLDLVLYVHAPPAIDCGPHDVENVEVRF